MNENVLRVTASDLESALRIIIARVVERRGEVLSIPHDYFWAIPVESLYDVYSPPKDFTIGQLSESITSVEAIVSGLHEPIGYDLVWLADVLRAIGHGPE
jgi:hypothetical protein